MIMKMSIKKFEKSINLIPGPLILREGQNKCSTIFSIRECTRILSSVTASHCMTFQNCDSAFDEMLNAVGVRCTPHVINDKI